MVARAMDIFITLDYEIYFGSNTGTVAKCIIEPTEMLIKIAQKHDVQFSFFVDCGFLLKLDEFRKKYSALEKDYTVIVSQIKQLSSEGHDIQLHIHPHWEDSYYNGEQWIINTKRYKLADFSSNEIEDIVKRYKKVIIDITGKAVFVNRAGGWCMQPFDKLKDSMKANGIKVDSTVFTDAKNLSHPYNYDFTNAPNKTSWTFEDNPVEEKENGFFKEIAISSIKVSPLFYWKLFLVGRMNPYQHKPLGDGRPIASSGYRRNLLSNYTQQPVSIDGDNAKLLNKALRQTSKKGNEFVVLGHPKALSRFSINALEAFVIQHKANHNFTTYTNYFKP